MTNIYSYDRWCQTEGNTNVSGAKIKGSTKFSWRIKNFSDREEEKGDCIQSDDFVVISPNGLPTHWYMEVYPYGTEEATSGFLSVAICLRSEGIKARASFVLCVVSKNQREELFYTGSYKGEEFEPDCLGYERWDALHISDLQEKWLVEDSLTISCDISVFEAISMPNCKKRQERIMGRKIQEDLGKAFTLKEPIGCDVTITCGDESFECSKFMLMARSNVFKLMFQSNMQESQTNNVNIEDLKPPVVAEMLHYIHTGKAPKIDDYAQELLAAADRYQLDDLKRTCEENLISTLTVENMFDILILSYLVSADKLRKDVIKYVTENLSSSSVDWKKELAGYPSLWPDIVEAFMNLTSELKKGTS